MRRELKHKLRTQRRAVKAQIKQQRADLKRARRNAQKQRPRRWRLRLVLLIIVLLLLLLRECNCEGPAVAVAPPPSPPPAVKVVKKVPVVKKAPIRRRLRRRRRPSYDSTPKKPKRWLSDFRLQVSGRSIRLASCFEGIERPGAVRWVSAVDPATGRVTDHVLEPVASSIALSTKQKKCLTKVLSNPPYRLSVNDAPSTPERVGIVVEF